MFNEYFNPPPCVDPQVPAGIAPDAAVSTGKPFSTIIDQDAPSTSTSQTTQETPSPVIPLGVEEVAYYIEVAHMDNNPYVDFLIPKPSFEESSSQELVPRLDRVMIITLKWIYKVKLDELGDPENPNHVYKLKKALYELKQALRAWYDLLLSFLLSQKFSKGTVDPTLFDRREGQRITLLVHDLWLVDIIILHS
ncbi:retrovirus-related pol polyprotein from transposon TNT 1-94 [Tanacetum coccineum]